ncbi:MAG: molecular chaperone GrpE [Gemmatimonadetes bacterium]|nr:molecular chaperone GrpE [Gemmatimonadota bacterium]
MPDIEQERNISGIVRQIPISDEAEFDDVLDTPSDLLSAWQGQVRGLADHPPVNADDNATSMLAQLRVVADDLARPASRSARTKLLTTGEQELPIVSLDDASNDTPTAAVFDISGIQRSIEDAQRRIESTLTNSESRLAAAFNQALTGLADRTSSAHESLLADMRSQLAEAREQIDGESRGALQRAIGMLSVLESLDDVVASVNGRADDASIGRIQRFEREARAMAQLVELEEIPSEGAVDPDLHEIVSTVGGTARAGSIVEVRQRGYTFRGRVVRPAQVVVSARGKA